MTPAGSVTPCASGSNHPAMGIRPSTYLSWYSNALTPRKTKPSSTVAAMNPTWTLRDLPTCVAHTASAIVREDAMSTAVLKVPIFQSRWLLAAMNACGYFIR